MLEYYDFQASHWGVLTEKPDWVFGAEMVSCRGRWGWQHSPLIICMCSLYTLGGVASRQVDKYEPEEDRWTDGSWPSLRC